MSTFAEMSLPLFLAQRLQDAGMHNPTPVQKAAIPLALEGRDIDAASLQRFAHAASDVDGGRIVAVNAEGVGAHFDDLAGH